MPRGKKRKNLQEDTNVPSPANDPIHMVLKKGRHGIGADASPAGSLSHMEDDSDNESMGSRGRRSMGKKDDMVGFNARNYIPERSLRDRRRAPSPKPDSNGLQETLQYLQKLMERKDNQHFFTFPINDTIAPGYSKVIECPMDLSTTKAKIENKQYNNVMEYKADMKLLCVNAMTYNHPETIYYKAAQRLLEYAMKTMSKERLLQMAKNVPYMANVTETELALHLEVDASDYIAPVRVQKKRKDKNSYLHFEPIPDHLPAKDILVIAQEKAHEASEMLNAQQPNAKIGFLTMEADGTTLLNILNPDNTGLISEKERIITVGQKTSRLLTGKPYLDLIQVDDDSSLAKPMQYLEGYGAFASSAPTYDSSFANLSKRETDMLLASYGSQAGLDYVQSLKAFVADADPVMKNRIDVMLDEFTGNRHSAVQTIIQKEREKQMKSMEVTPPPEQHSGPPTELPAELPTVLPAEPPTNLQGGLPTDLQGGVPQQQNTQPTKHQNGPNDQSDKVDYDSLRSLKDLGIDTDFLDFFEKPISVQQQLNAAGEQISELRVLQNERLSQPPVTKPQQITRKEEDTAHNIIDSLADLTQQAKPADVVDNSRLRLALGVGLVPVNKKNSGEIVDELLAKGSDLDSDSQASEHVPHIPVNQSPSEKQ